MTLLTCIFSFIAIIVALNLRSRVVNLERTIETLKNKQPESKQQTVPTPLSDTIVAQIKQGVVPDEIKNNLLSGGWKAEDIDAAFSNLTQQAQTQNEGVLAAGGPTSFDRFTVWLKEDWLLKLGALLLIVGFGWLTTYAFLNNWIGPMGRIALGIIAGAIFISFGWWRVKKYLHQGGIFMVLGSTVILLTIFAAREVYGFFNPISALVVMFLSTAFVSLASVKYNSRSLALSGLILAGVAPLLVRLMSVDYISLFGYLIVVVLGTVWIVAITGRRELTTAALTMVFLYSLPHLTSSFGVHADKGVLLLFEYAFAVIFFFTNTIGILKLKDKEIIPDLFTAAGNGLLLLFWIMSAGQEEWKSLIIISWMVVFIVAAFLIFKATQRKEPFYVYAGIGITMLATATSVELKGASLAIAYIIEGGIIPLVAYKVLNDVRVSLRLSFIMLLPIICSMGSITSRAWDTGVFHKDFFVLFILGAVLMGMGLFFMQKAKELADKNISNINTILLIVGSVYIYVLIWLSAHARMHDDYMSVMIPLVVYTIVGIVCYFYGQARDKNILKVYGGIMVGIVVMRLILADVWRMEMAGRIVTFFLIGALLTATAFLAKRKDKLNLTTSIK